MPELLSIMKSDCRAVTVATISVKLWKIFQNLWRVGNNRFGSNLWSQLHKTDHVRGPKEICVRVLAQRHLCDRVCVFVPMLGPQKASETVLGCRLLCSAFQNRDPWYYRHRPDMKIMPICLADKRNTLTHMCSGCASD